MSGLKDFDKAYDDAELSIPDGIYVVRVDKVRLATTRKTGAPMICWELRILGPTHENQVLFKNSVITEKSVRFVKQDFEKCGLELETFSSLEDNPALLEPLLDLVLEVHKKTSGEYENVYFKGIVEHDSNINIEQPPDDKIPF